MKKEADYLDWAKEGDCKVDGAGRHEEYTLSGRELWKLSVPS